MERSPQVAQLLAQFPGPISFDRTPLSKALHQAAKALIALGAIYYVWLHPTMIGFLKGAVMFALGGLIALTKVRWTLDHTGFFTAYGRGIRWSESRDFKTRMTRSGALICFDGNEPVRSWTAWSNRLLTGRDFWVYVDPGGLSNTELDELMNGWRQRSIRAASE